MPRLGARQSSIGTQPNGAEGVEPGLWSRGVGALLQWLRKRSHLRPPSVAQSSTHAFTPLVGSKQWGSTCRRRPCHRPSWVITADIKVGQSRAIKGHLHEPSRASRSRASTAGYHGDYRGRSRARARGAIRE